ncbi:SulP family inorganic anion transporter [Leeia oryzae]|uniref:SulP family inorganic anion transporter n=1 Tax=Leeia oryzae TaxID=356662 RepID=UPI00035F3CF9|nr:SulP family inorganic anion transporter [Leeia oryzae]
MSNEGILPNRNTLPGDVWGGVAAMLVALPSAIAFGVAIFSALGGALAADGALAGILGAIVLGIAAPLFGGRSLIVTAPSAPAAAVLTALAVTLTQQGNATSTILIQLALIGLLAGILQIGFGFSGIGRLIRYIPYPVVSGYLSGVGIIIISGQIPRFLGVPSSAHLLDVLLTPALWHWQSIVIGVLVIAVMYWAPRFIRIIPASILALVAGVAGYVLLGLLGQADWRTTDNPLLVGVISSGNVPMSEIIHEHWMVLRGIGMQEIAQVLAPALTLAALLSIDTLKTGLVVETLTNKHQDPDRELIGQGVGNLLSALVGGISGSGTMGASLVNISSGGSTWLSTWLTGIASLLVLLMLAPLIAWVPIPALAGILMVIGVRMIDRHSLAFFFTPATRLDFVVIFSVIMVSVFVNLVAAAGVGVALAIMLFIREQTRSSVIRSRIEGSEIFSKRTARVSAAEGIDPEGKGVVVFELQGSLFFGTASQLQAALEPEIPHRKFVILSMRRVQSLDVTATHVLEKIKDQLDANNAHLVFCDIPKGLPSGLKMKRFLKATGLVGFTSKAIAFNQLDDALEWVESRQLAEANVPPAMENATFELRAMPMFASCTEEAMAALTAVAELRLVKEGKRIYKAGGEGNALFLIRKGLVKLKAPIRKKGSYHLATCGAGEMIGEMGFLEGGVYLMDATAAVETEVYVLTKEQFDQLSALYPDLAHALLYHMAHALAVRLHASVIEIQALRR